MITEIQGISQRTLQNWCTMFTYGTNFVSIFFNNFKMFGKQYSLCISFELDFDFLFIIHIQLMILAPHGFFFVFFVYISMLVLIKNRNCIHWVHQDYFNRLTLKWRHKFDRLLWSSLSKLPQNVHAAVTWFCFLSRIWKKLSNKTCSWFADDWGWIRCSSLFSSLYRCGWCSYLIEKYLFICVHFISYFDLPYSNQNWPNTKTCCVFIDWKKAILFLMQIYWLNYPDMPDEGKSKCATDPWTAILD